MMKGNMGVAVLLAASAYGSEYFTSNARTWDMAEVDFATIYGGFVPTGGLKISGEIAWHEHGTGKIRD